MAEAQLHYLVILSSRIPFKSGCG